MVSIREQALVPAPIEDVLPIILDPPALAACLPCAVLTPAGDDRHWQGVVSLQFGQELAEFRCEFRIQPDGDVAAVLNVRGVHEGSAATIAAAVNVIATATTMIVMAPPVDDSQDGVAEPETEEIRATQLAASGKFVMNGEIVGLKTDAALSKSLFEAFVQNIVERVARADEPEPEIEADVRLDPRAEARAAAAEFLPDGPMDTLRRSATDGQPNPVDLLLQIIKDFFAKLLSGKK